MRQTSSFDVDKYRLVYCGRSANYQWWDRWDMINGENNEGDWWAVKGYLSADGGENMTTNQQLNYYRSGFAYTQWYAQQVTQHYEYMEQTIGNRLPLFLYEGNLDRDDYYYRLGQSIVYLDFLATMIRAEVAMPMVFIFATGAQWGIINNKWGNYKRQPLYYAGLLYNNYCQGHMVSSTATNMPQYTHPEWSGVLGGPVTEQTYDLVGHYGFKQGSNYSILLINRDFENDHDITIQLPAGNFSNEAYLYKLTGNDWNDFNA